MANQELLRIVDGIARDKNIEKEQVYVDVEAAGVRSVSCTSSVIT